MTTCTIRSERIPEQVVRGMRLGRHIRHDSRSRAYAVAEQPARTLVSVAHPRHIPILDQGDVGSCTGNAAAGAIGTSPLWDAEKPGLVLDEAGALRLYSAAEVIDGNGAYPPVDDGSSGLSVARAAKNAGLISGYQHAFSLLAMQSALQSNPVIVGTNWLTGMDSPDASGLVHATGSVRGGHEYECREMDMAAGLFWCDNSWGTGYGNAGRFAVSFADMGKLLADSGDVTVLLPLSSPPPVPVPVSWTHPDLTFGHDPRVIAWSGGAHLGEEAHAAQQYQAWRKARGYA